MPNDPRAECLRRAVRQRLATVEQRLLDQLRLLAQAEFPREAEHLGIEIDIASRGDFDPVVWCACKGDFHVLSADCPWDPPVPMYRSLMEPVIVYSGDIRHGCGIGEEEFEYSEIVELECLLFIHECWARAGGGSVSVYATTQAHDSGWMLNLKTGEWERM